MYKPSTISTIIILCLQNTIERTFVFAQTLLSVKHHDGSLKKDKLWYKNIQHWRQNSIWDASPDTKTTPLGSFQRCLQKSIPQINTFLPSHTERCRRLFSFCFFSFCPLWTDPGDTRGNRSGGRRWTTRGQTGTVSALWTQACWGHHGQRGPQPGPHIESPSRDGAIHTDRKGS